MSGKDHGQGKQGQQASGPWAIPTDETSGAFGTSTSRTALSSSSLSGSSVASGGPWSVFDRGPSAASLSTIQMVEDGLRRRPARYMLGSPARRCMAKLIDRLLLGLAALPALLADQLGAPWPLCAVLLGLAWGLALGFEWYLSACKGQSPGKYLLGLRVIGANGDKVDFRQAVLLRVWLMGLGALVLAGVPLLVDLALMFGEDRRALHDRLAKTRVILAGSLGDPYASL